MVIVDDQISSGDVTDSENLNSFETIDIEDQPNSSELAVEGPSLGEEVRNFFYKKALVIAVKNGLMFFSVLLLSLHIEVNLC